MKPAMPNVNSRRVPAIERIFAPIYGQPCWGVNYERYLNLSLNFGPPHLSVREPHSSAARSKVVRRKAARRLVTVRGRWWLWIYVSYWRLSYNGVIVSNQRWPAPRKMPDMLHDLEGQKLTCVRANPQTGATRFDFDLGAKLEVWKLDDDEVYELWTLYVYSPRRRVFSLHSDGSLTSQ